mmetsp:Transcript_7243/g.22384  ORF Transcript_7243/g.22384 Transcript_7243/m.22384 type:complete len:81 (+) Transcript_7243:225-467(+)
MTGQLVPDDTHHDHTLWILPMTWPLTSQSTIDMPCVRVKNSPIDIGPEALVPRRSKWARVKQRHGEANICHALQWAVPTL